MRRIILASGSPRRRELLEKFFDDFEVIPSGYEEELGLDMNPNELVEYIALQKAKDVAKKVDSGVIIAADSLIFYKNKILGKPKNEKEAKEMLRKQSGKEVNSLTGLAVIDKSQGKILKDHRETKVKMKKMTQEEIEAYVKTGEPLGMAGAFAVQGKGSIFIKEIRGSFYSVVGLPLYELNEMLSELGFLFLNSTG